MSERGATRVLAVLALALSTTTWWYLFWGARPGYFDIEQALRARAALSDTQRDLPEAFRVLFPWIYVAARTLFTHKLSVVVAQLASSVVFFGGCSRLCLGRQPETGRWQYLAVMAVMAFYGLSAFQSVHRYGELLAPGLLAAALSFTHPVAAVGTMILLSLSRLDTAAVALFVLAAQWALSRRRAWDRRVWVWLVQCSVFVGIAVVLRAGIRLSPDIPNTAGIYDDYGHLKVAAALNPYTWVWYGMYLLPAGLLAWLQRGRCSPAFLAGGALVIALTLVFGSWSEFRLLLPAVVLLACARESGARSEDPIA